MAAPNARQLPGYLPVKQLRLYYPNLLSIHSQWMMRGQEDAEIQAADALRVSRTEMLFRLLQDVCDTEILLEKTACQQYQEAKAHLVGLNRVWGEKSQQKKSSVQAVQVPSREQSPTGFYGQVRPEHHAGGGFELR